MKLPENIKKRLSLPLVAAPMFLVSGPDLVVACCKEGIIGTFPCSNARTLEDLEKWMQRFSSEISSQEAPWVPNLIVHSSYTRLEEELKLVTKYKPEIVITALGSPKRVNEVVHAYGGLVFSDVNSLNFARKAAQTGVDGLILVCAGAGGHTGMLSPFAFVNEVRKFWDGIILVAGAISDGRAIRATEILGADLAYVGTSFIPTKESLAFEEYKKMVTESCAEDLVLTAGFTGVPANFLKQSIINEGIPIEEVIDKKALVDFNQLSTEKPVKAWKHIWSAGQGVGSSQKVLTVKELVTNFKEEYNKVV